MNFKDRTKISASLFINLAEHIPLNNHTFGYVVDKNSLLDQKKPRHIKYYFCPVFTKTDYPKCSIKSKGTYLTLYIKRIYKNKYTGCICHRRCPYKGTSSGCDCCSGWCDSLTLY